MSASEYDVIIVGAGVSGLAAAKDLVEGGARIIILEARDRVGGRIFTQHPKNGGAPIELGAEFVHGGNFALSEILAGTGLRQKVVEEKHWWIDGEKRRAMTDVWARIDRVLKRIGPATTGSFASWMRTQRGKISAADAGLTEAFVAGFEGAPLDKMSVRTLAVAGSIGEGKQTRLGNGYDSLIAVFLRRLARRRVSIRLHSPVTCITWKPQDVTVHTRGRSFKAKTVLLTLPLGVLKAKPPALGAIRFVPPLRGKQPLWDQLESGHTSRVVLRLRPDAWKSPILPAELRARSGRNFGFLHSLERDFPVWWSHAPAPVMVGWSGGDAAAAMGKLSDKEICRRAVSTLAKLISARESELAKIILESRTHNWTADPYTRGAYSFSFAGLEDAPGRLAIPVDRTLFFAGEATADPLELGTVHGALASGQRAAREILNALPQT